MKIVKYFFVGGTAAAVDIVIFSIFAGYFGLPWIPVSIFTFILATFISYFLSIRFVFQSGARYEKKQEIFWIFVVSALGLLLNQTVMYFCIVLLNIHLIISKIIATGIVFFWNYFARSRIIFSNK
jgi:putative flippase GtrA